MSGGNAEQPLFEANGRIDPFVALARLDNRPELGHALQVPPSELAHTSDATLLMRMAERWGDEGVARCLGAFAFALWDVDERRLTLGRDCLGNRALYFHRGRNFAAFATTLNALLTLPYVPREIDELTLAHFMAVNFRETHRTFYRGIERVPSRTIVTLDRNDTRHRHYWSPNFGAPPPYRRDEDYIERARELFDQAVAAATADTPYVAASTSGGLDSSAIAATAARLGRAERITCYTMVPPEGAPIAVPSTEYADERGKVAALGRMHPTLDLRFLAPEETHPFERDDTRYFMRTGLPVHGPANLGWFSFMHDAVATDGHRAMLIGFHGNFGLSWPGKFSLLALLRAAEWRRFSHEISALARDNGHGLARSFVSNILVTGGPTGLRRLVHRLRGRNPDSVAHFSALNPAFIEETDLPRQWQTEGFDPWFRPNGSDPVRHRAYYLFDNNQMARDSRAMSGDLHGFEMRDPHSDRRLLEFALSVPEPIYSRDAVPRSFARAVFADRLPREILDERRRGAQGGAWFHRLDMRRKDIAAEVERLEASPLASRLIDLPRLRKLVREWPAGEEAAHLRNADYRYALSRGIHVGRFIRWVEGGNA